MPLSENLIVGFFFDMIHDFPESSVMTNDSKTDVNPYYGTTRYSVVIGPNADTPLKIIKYFNEQHGYVEAPKFLLSLRKGT